MPQQERWRRYHTVLRILIRCSSSDLLHVSHHHSAGHYKHTPWLYLKDTIFSYIGSQDDIYFLTRLTQVIHTTNDSNF